MRATGIDQGRLSRVERGLMTPSLAELEVIAKALSVKPKTLLRD